jgi:peptidoglycan/xylan/chitin deacetylase (PgdA/CDA1 family)
LDILRPDTAARLKLRRWRRKLGVLLQPNALHMSWHRWRGAAGGARARPPLILMYHRVSDLDTDPQMLCVRPQRFAAQLEALRTRYEVVSLRELVQRREQGQAIEGLAAITFDDGYADNLLTARPLLERHGTPATVFVASSYVGRDAEFWWDELERVLLRPGKLPATLQLQVGDRAYRANLGEDASYDESSCARDRTWNLHCPATPTRRHALYRYLHRMLYLLDSPQREELLEQLRAWAGLAREARATHRPLDEAQTVALAHGDVVEVGAHTATHPVLSMLPIEQQKAEIELSKRALEHILSRPVTTFAYPYGSLSDYRAQTVKVVADLGFECACSTFAATVDGGYDRFQLPRFTVRDWTGEEFLARLERWTFVR